MSNEEESIYIIEFLGKNIDQESWSEKLLSCGNHKGYKKLWVSSGSISGVDKTPAQREYKNALKGDFYLDKNHKIR